MYDIVVSGARCAGATTAMLLARAGFAVLLLDRARFPRDTLSTHYIHQSGVHWLARWGLLDALRASGCPPITRGVHVAHGARLDGWAPEHHGAAYAPRRDVLDTLLAKAAVRSGAEFRDGCSLEGLLVDGQRVTGVRYRTPGGASETARARLVIGADGMRSAVAQLTGAREYGVRPRLSCVYYSYWQAPACFETYERGRLAVGAAPTHEGLTMVAVYFPQSEFARVSADPMAAYVGGIRTAAPELFERLDGRLPVERLRGTGDQRNFFREAAGAGWALVGDSGHHRDSITAQGITNAWLQADLLAECLRGDDFDAGLQRFADQRDELLRDSYRATVALAKRSPSAETAAMVRAVGQYPELTTLYFGLIGGVVGQHELFRRMNLAD